MPEKTYEQRKEYFKEYYQKNRHRIHRNPRYVAKKAAWNKKWRLENKALHNEKNRVWAQQHPHTVLAKTRRYQIGKLNATPKWANKKYINLFYLIARMETERTGIKCHVDHIVPLQSKIVCGLHVEHNLQIMFGGDNKSKGNRFWPDHPIKGGVYA